MRIVHVLTRFLRAGTEENTAITCNGQVEAGNQVWVVHGAEAQAEALDMLDPRVGRICVPSLVHPPNLPKDTAALLAMRKIFQDLNADLVHTHQSKAGALGRLAAKLADVRHIVHGVHILPFMNAGPMATFVYGTVERLLADYTDAYIHVTPALQEACLAAGVGKKAHHSVVASGMDVSAFQNAKSPDDAGQLLQPLKGFSERPLILLLVSALERRKRHAEFLAVFEQVIETTPNVRLLLAGEGPEREAIEQLIAQRGLSDHVMLLGLRNDVERLIRLADVGVLASEREGLARAVIQYALGGLPIVSPDHPGIRRVIQEGINGYLCEINDLGALSGGLQALLNDDTLRRRMARASAKVDLSDWAANRMVDRIADVYRIIGAKPLNTRTVEIPTVLAGAS